MVRIRSMLMEDCKAVHEIEQQCFADSWSYSMFEELFRYPSNCYFVAENQGEVCGFAGILVTIETADVMNIGVHPAYRQQGIGRMLLNALMDEAKQRGCHQMLLEVRESNQIAIQLYESCGFSQIAVRKKYYSQPLEDGLVMQCDLKRS